MKISFLFFSLLLAFASHAIADPGKQLDALFESYWEEKSRLFPLDATQQGDNRYNHLLPDDQTAEFRGKLQKFYQRYLSELKKIPEASLTKEQKLSLRVFEYDLENQIEGLSFKG